MVFGGPGAAELGARGERGRRQQPDLDGAAARHAPLAHGEPHVVRAHAELPAQDVVPLHDVGRLTTARGPTRTRSPATEFQSPASPSRVASEFTTRGITRLSMTSEAPRSTESDARAAPDSAAVKDQSHTQQGEQNPQRESGLGPRREQVQPK